MSDSLKRWVEEQFIAHAEERWVEEHGGSDKDAIGLNQELSRLKTDNV